jgi:hypothetical protein
MKWKIAKDNFYLEGHEGSEEKINITTKARRTRKTNTKKSER